AIGGDDQGPVQRVAHPQVSSVLGQEGSPLHDSIALRPGGKAMSQQQAMHRGAMQRASGDDLGALEHADDASDGAAGALALDAQNLLSDLGRDDSATTPIRTILREQRRKAA